MIKNKNHKIEYGSYYLKMNRSNIFIQQNFKISTLKSFNRQLFQAIGPVMSAIFKWIQKSPLNSFNLRSKNNQVAPDPLPNTDSNQSLPKVVHDKKIDERLLNGPINERSCTDIICFLLFILSVAALAYISIQGYSKGKPDRLLALYDPNGSACGIDYPNFPYLYWALPYGQYYNRTTCVQFCPNYTTSQQAPVTLTCQTNKLVTSCLSKCLQSSDLSVSNLESETNLSTFVCIFNSTQMFNRFCYPTYFVDQLSSRVNFQSVLSLDTVSTYVSDLQTTAYAIYASFGVAFLLGLIYLYMTRILAGILVWLSIILYFIGMGFGAYWCYKQDQYYTSIKDDKTNSYTTEQQTNASNNQLTFQYLTYVMYALIVLSMIALGCIFRKLQLAVAVIKTAALCVKDNFLLILVPPITSIFVAALWFWWIYTAMQYINLSKSYVYSIGDVYGNGNSPFAQVTMNDVQKQYLWYFIFGGLWKNAFLQAVNNFIISSTVCIWYFSQNDQGQGGEKPITRSVYRSFRYHLGSLAFGSLILAIVQFIRIILEYVKFQTEKLNKENKAVKCLLNCLSCVMACFERFVRFLTYNTYIMIALTGKSFCPAAKEAFETIWANAMRFSLVNGIGAVFIAVGKFCITIVTLMIFYYVITTMPYFSDGLFSPVLPCIVVFVIAYCMSLLFMTVYGMACDAILICFIFDEDLNKQNNGQSAQHCPELLREFLERDDMKQVKEA
ncbi:hypothetical protein pb186bvf_013024 [Paramecium bursaria]